MKTKFFDSSPVWKALVWGPSAWGPLAQALASSLRFLSLKAWVPPYWNPPLCLAAPDLKYWQYERLAKLAMLIINRLLSPQLLSTWSAT